VGTLLRLLLFESVMGRMLGFDTFRETIKEEEKGLIEESSCLVSSLGMQGLSCFTSSELDWSLMISAELFFLFQTGCSKKFSLKVWDGLFTANSACSEPFRILSMLMW
jgi:hypothetical protein